MGFLNTNPHIINSWQYVILHFTYDLQFIVTGV